MTNYEYLTSLSLAEFLDWLDKNGQFYNSPWQNWFDENYCNKCEAIKCSAIDLNWVGIKPPWLSDTIECAYCEIEKKCRFFEKLETVPDNRKIFELWLMQEVAE